MGEARLILILWPSQKVPHQFRPTHSLVQILFIFLSLPFFTACVGSPGPDVQDLIKIKAPTFSGSSTKAFTSPSQTFTLSGTCDPLSHSIEYAKDAGSFVIVQNDCLSRTFSIPLTLTEGKTTISVRAKGKFSYSDSAVASIHFVLPPTAPYVTMVQSSASDNSDLNGRGTQNTIGLNFTGESSSSAANRMEFNLPGVIYGQ